MAFKVFEKLSNTRVRLLDNQFKLAGYGFINNIWKELGSPKNAWVAQYSLINKCLHAHYKTQNDLIIIIPTMNYEMKVEEIWGLTYINTNNTVEWTPVLFVGKEIIFNQGCEKVSDESAIEAKNELYQFMYLQGDKGSWNWGAGGPNTSPLLNNESFTWFNKAFR